MTTEEFIQKAHSIHGNKYDYSKVEYTNNKTKICIICPEHGEFWQDSSHHFRGHGCPKCCPSGIKLTNENFISKARSIHGEKYNYSKVEYKNAQTKICIICPEHGEFYQKPHSHLNNHGCPKCKGYLANHTKAKESFIEKARSIHGNKYDYSKVKYVSTHEKICIICTEHGEFWQTPALHLKRAGCPKCNESHGEREIRKLLDKYNIKYEREKTFSKLNSIRGFPLRFDFYLPDDNICIEFDGIQHKKFIPIMHRSEKQFEILKEHDRRKNEFCKKNGIHLIRIWKDEENRFHEDKIC